MPGLSSREVDERIRQGLDNEQVNSSTRTVKQIIQENVFTYFNLIFTVLGVLLVIVGSFKDLTFMLIVLANTAIGIAQEIRSKQTLDKLKLMKMPKCHVIRDGREKEVAVEDLVPGTISLGGVQKVLQLLVRENVSIRDMLTIVETLGDFGGGVKNPDMLAEYVREKLSRSIVRPYLDSQGVLPVLTLNGNAERMVQEGIRQTDNGATFLSLNPAAAQRLVQNINSAVENAVNTDGQPVILASPIVRPHLAQLITRFLPTVPVISQAEIPSDIRLQAVGTVSAE